MIFSFTFPQNLYFLIWFHHKMIFGKLSIAVGSKFVQLEPVFWTTVFLTNCERLFYFRQICRKSAPGSQKLSYNSMKSFNLRWYIFLGCYNFKLDTEFFSQMKVQIKKQKTSASDRPKVLLNIISFWSYF